MDLTCFTVVIGGLRLGMMIALPYCLAEWGTRDCKAAPSRKCRCQSSGFVIVNCEGDLLAKDMHRRGLSSLIRGALRASGSLHGFHRSEINCRLLLGLKASSMTIIGAGWRTLFIRLSRDAECRSYRRNIDACMIDTAGFSEDDIPAEHNRSPGKPYMSWLHNKLSRARGPSSIREFVLSLGSQDREALGIH